MTRLQAFIDEEVLPHVLEQDQMHEYPQHLVARMRDLHIFGAISRSVPLFAAVMEELGRGWVSLVPIANANSSVVWTLTHHATPGQRERWLPSCDAGTTLAALALTEPAGGSDLGAITSYAERLDDGWLLTAHKTFITHARNAQLMLLIARTESQTTDVAKAMSLFMLEKGEWEIVRDLPKLGTLGIETCEIRINGATLSSDRLIGEVAGRGFPQLMDALEVGRIAVAAAAVGLARASLRDAITYAQTRSVFGAPLISHQGIAFTLAGLASRVAAARALVFAAAQSKQPGARCDLQTSMAKLVSTEVAAEASLTAIRVLGGNGYLKDYNAERYYRDAPMLLVGEGTNEVMKMIIGRHLVGDADPAGWT
jgi:alkylation response protein AidB-like acyl-CoA dehydrogenase